MALRNYPILTGSASSIGGAFVSMMEALDPFVRFLALLVGLLVGVVTLLIKWEEVKIKRLERLEIEGELNLESGKLTLSAETREEDER